MTITSTTIITGIEEAIAAASPPAEKGLSAYQVALDQGFVGDETAWLASLVGPTGPAGSQGPQGPAGPSGPPGPAGSTSGDVSIRSVGYQSQTITSSGAIIVDGSSQSVKFVSLTGNVTFSFQGFAGNKAVTMIVSGNGHTATFQGVSEWLGGAPPRLASSGRTYISIYENGGTLYGAAAFNEASLNFNLLPSLP